MVKVISGDMIEDSKPQYLDKRDQLAPQEVYRPGRHPIQARSEMSKSERQRLWKRLKQARKAQAQQREERLVTLARLNPRKQAMLDKHRALKSLAKNKNVTIISKKDKKAEPSLRKS